MSDDAALEALVRAALDRSGAPPPFPVDVTETVMARVAEFGPAPRSELAGRELVRWASAAALAGVALVAGAIWRGPSLGDVAGQLGRTTADTAGTAAKLSVGAGTLLDGLAHAAVAIAASLGALLRPLAPLQPYAHGLLAAVAAGMLATAAVIVVRDFRSSISDKEQA